MSSPQMPVVAENAASPGPTPLPAITRVVAVLVLVFAGLGLLSALSQIGSLSQMRSPVLGVLVSPHIAIPFTIFRGALNLVLAILILRRYVWALDALIATQLFGVLNNGVYLLSPARNAYAATVIARTQARMPATPGLNPDLYRTFTSVALSIGIGVSVAIAVVFIALLVADRRRFRAVCLPRPA
ncbi:MAG: hypothetical protein ACRD3S_12445 [Terracidiphilus sp.]